MAPEQEFSREEGQSAAEEAVSAQDLANGGQVDTEGELFPGDTGTLPAPARRVLVQLLRSSYISYESNAKDWPCLIEYRSFIKSALNDLFLELFIDVHNDIAYCLPVEEAGESFLKLKREHELTDLQSLLIVFLRQQYASQASSGAENVWVDGKDIYEYLEKFFSGSVVNHAQSAKTIASAIDYMKRQRYLESVRGVQDRYRVLPVIETAFPLERVQKVLEAYEQDALKRAGALASTDGARAEEE